MIMSSIFLVLLPTFQVVIIKSAFLEVINLKIKMGMYFTMSLYQPRQTLHLVFSL